MTVRLKINHIVLRYDNVPLGIISGCFERSIVQSRGVVLSKDFFWKRSVSVDELCRVRNRIEVGPLGEEMRRLSGLGLTPVFHVDFTHRATWAFFFILTSENVKLLVRNHSGFSMTVHTFGNDYVVELTQKSLEKLNGMGCSIELS